MGVALIFFSISSFSQIRQFSSLLPSLHVFFYHKFSFPFLFFNNLFFIFGVILRSFTDVYSGCLIIVFDFTERTKSATVSPSIKSRTHRLW